MDHNAACFSSWREEVINNTVDMILQLVSAHWRFINVDKDQTGFSLTM